MKHTSALQLGYRHCDFQAHFLTKSVPQMNDIKQALQTMCFSYRNKNRGIHKKYSLAYEKGFPPGCLQKTKDIKTVNMVSIYGHAHSVPTHGRGSWKPDNFFNTRSNPNHAISCISHLPHPRICSFWYTSMFLLWECLIQWDDEYQLREQSQLILIPVQRARVQLLGEKGSHTVQPLCQVSTGMAETCWATL